MRLLGIAFETAVQALHNWGVADTPRDVVSRERANGTLSVGSAAWGAAYGSSICWDSNRRIRPRAI